MKFQAVKRILAAAAALAMITLSLSACIKIEQAPETTEEQTTAATEASTETQATTQAATEAQSEELAVSEAQAKEIVLSKIQGASESDINKFHKDFDDGRWTYEGEIFYGGHEYDFEVDAQTGEILSWEIDD